MQMPREIGTFHIIGIGGIGMSAIAEILHRQGLSRSRAATRRTAPTSRRLRAKGIRVFIGHDAAISSAPRSSSSRRAVKAGNPELEAARAKGLPIIRRAEMLAELMRLYSTVSVTGTHGKTTTTSLIAHMFNGGRPRPDRDHRRHHQRLGHQRAPRQGRVDDRRGRRVRRHLRQAADRRSASSPTSTPSTSTTSRLGREHAPGVRDLLPQHSRSTASPSPASIIRWCAT